VSVYIYLGVLGPAVVTIWAPVVRCRFSVNLLDYTIGGTLSTQYNYNLGPFPYTVLFSPYSISLTLEYPEILPRVYSGVGMMPSVKPPLAHWNISRYQGSWFSDKDVNIWDRLSPSTAMPAHRSPWWEDLLEKVYCRYCCRSRQISLVRFFSVRSIMNVPFQKQRLSFKLFGTVFMWQKHLALEPVRSSLVHHLMLRPLKILYRAPEG